MEEYSELAQYASCALWIAYAKALVRELKNRYEKNKVIDSIISSAEVVGVILFDEHTGEPRCQVFPDDLASSTSGFFMSVSTDASTQAENLFEDIPPCDENQIAQISKVSQFASFGSHSGSGNQTAFGFVSLLGRSVYAFTSCWSGALVGTGFREKDPFKLLGSVTLGGTLIGIQWAPWEKLGRTVVGIPATICGASAFIWKWGE